MHTTRCRPADHLRNVPGPQSILDVLVARKAVIVLFMLDVRLVECELVGDVRPFVRLRAARFVYVFETRPVALLFARGPIELDFVQTEQTEESAQVHRQGAVDG